jgi:hypothetical protein
LNPPEYIFEASSARCIRLSSELSLLADEAHYMIDTDPNHAIMKTVSPDTPVFSLMKYSDSGTMKKMGM